MGAAPAFAAAAVLVACAFTAATFERWLARRRRHDLAWATSMALFAAGALAYFFGVALGWGPWSFKAFYLLGGVLTVPVLALGTIYLLAGRRWGDRLALATALLGAFAAGVVVAAPLRRPLSADRLDAGREVLGIGPRVLAATGSGVGATVVIAGALWSAGRLLRHRTRADVPDRTTGRLAVANLMIAAGTLLISLKRPFEVLAGSEETGFAMALSVGLAVMFAGFLLAAGLRTPPSAPPATATVGTGATAGDGPDAQAEAAPAWPPPRTVERSAGTVRSLVSPSPVPERPDAVRTP